METQIGVMLQLMICFLRDANSVMIDLPAARSPVAKYIRRVIEHI